jgi:PPE-repeat protein
MYHKYCAAKKELTSKQEELQKMNSLNKSLKNSTKQQTGLQEIQKFEKHTLDHVITASNMRTILLDNRFSFPGSKSKCFFCPMLLFSYLHPLSSYFSPILTVGDYQCPGPLSHLA